MVAAYAPITTVSSAYKDTPNIDRNNHMHAKTIFHAKENLALDNSTVAIARRFVNGKRMYAVRHEHDAAILNSV